MCGLVGFYSPGLASDDDIQLLKNLLVVDQIRGMHATGVAKVKTKENEVSYVKGAFDAVTFLSQEETQDFLHMDRGNIYIGHNRYATMGDKTDHDNAHPFMQDHITLVHNGGVDWGALDQLEGYHDKDVTVDSHMVTMTIAKHGIRKAVTEYLSGAFALVWWDQDERSLNFIRNSDRPLFMGVTTTGTLVWASEKGMLDVFLDRPGKYKYKVVPTALAKDSHYKFTFDENGKLLGQNPTLTPMEFFDVPKPVVNNYSGYYSTGSHGSSGNYSASSAVKTEDRVNSLLLARGLPLRYKQILTIDIVRIEEYTGDHNKGYGRVIGKCRASHEVVEVWGILIEDARKYETLRVILENAYEVHRQGAKELVLSGADAHVSCHDPKYISGAFQKLQVMSTTTQSPSNVTQLRPKKEPQGQTVHYPLKTHGHTFRSSVEFVDFVSQGCGTCGKIPTPYDRRNHHLVVIEGRNFQGLLSDCEFICGECGEE